MAFVGFEGVYGYLDYVLDCRLPSGRSPFSVVIHSEQASGAFLIRVSGWPMKLPAEVSEWEGLLSN